MEAQRNYKDRMFRLIFEEKKDLLSLYNAVNGTHHTNADDLEITTLGDAVCMRLSDAYEKPLASPELELAVTVYNINLGHNEELMNACQLLKEYAQYVDLVRRYKSEMPLSKAVERAVEESIRRGILEDFLKKQRAEAIAVSIFEYDQEKHMQSEREEHFRKGLEERTRSVVIKLLERGMPDDEICEVAECDMSLIDEIRRKLEE